MSSVLTNFWAQKRLIGMVHLGPLPGSPRDAGDFAGVLARAEADAKALVAGGVDAIMVENFFDAPFAKDSVPPHTLAALTRAALVVRDAAPELPLGINCLRNDAKGALAIAHIVGAQFVRVNVWVGAAVTDQGIIEGAAREGILYRKLLGAEHIQIFTDVFVKHAAQLGDGTQTIQDAAKDAVLRGMADALIVSGSATGSGTSPADVTAVAQAVPGTPVLIGSGFGLTTARELLDAGAAGAIVGSSLKVSTVDSPVDPEKVRALRAIMG
ncbi:MAG: BtpA/SgcQ family protein [Armatimonadetes bacterium]|nr:BtpA/SgcQ family protein [Armatimonadota bacterium]